MDVEKNLKYNRTLHLPWSEGATNDDKVAKDISNLIGKDITVTEKLDGSNVCLESVGCFARSHSGPPKHPSFDAFKAFHAPIKGSIPDNFQFFGEWLYAKHSLHYSSLPSYFFLFGVRAVTKNPFWLQWKEVESFASELGVPTPPVLFQGSVKSEKYLKELTTSFMNRPSLYGEEREGIVVRISDMFEDSNFGNCIFKQVRKDHVQTDDHWSHQQIVKNLKV